MSVRRISRLRAAVTHGASIATLAAGLLLSETVVAQESADSEQTEDESLVPAIVVTAERRETNLQETPLSVLAMTSEIVEAKGIEDLEDLAAFSPNLAIMPARGAGNNNASFVIRGVAGGGGATGERGVGLYVDGIYMPRTSGAVLSVIDIDRIEVLRGPQGTLFGRNSTGGAIRIFSKQPTDEFEGYLRGTIGNQGRSDLAGSINLPLAEGVALRAQGAYLRRGGYVEQGPNMLGRERDFVGRVQLRLEPSDRFEATFGLLYTDSHANGSAVVMSNFDMRPGIQGVIQGNYADWINDAFILAGGAPLAPLNDSRIVTGDPYRTNSLCFIDDFNPDYDVACDQFLDDRYVQANLQMVYDLSDDVRLTSVSGYADLVHTGQTDFSVLGIEKRTDNVESEVIYQELQLNAALFSDAIDLVVGGNYFHEDSLAPNFSLIRRGTSVFPSNPGTPPNADAGLFRSADTIIGQTSESWGLFASATWHLTDRLNFTGGLRHAWDTKDYSQTRFPATDHTTAPGTTSTTVNASDDFSALDWRATVDYHATDDVMAYFTMSKAYKAGAFSYTIANWTATNQATGAAQSAGIRSIPNERVINYEAGLRMTLFDRLVINPTGFVMDFTNRQAAVQVACGTGSLAGIVPGSAQCPVGFLIQVQNQGNVQLTGVEIDGRLIITPELSIDGAFAVTSADLTNAPAGTVNLFPDVPSPTWNVGFTYAPMTALGELTINANYVNVGPLETHPTLGTDSSYRLPGYNLLNARVRLDLEDLPASISLYANNLLDEVYATYASRFGGGFWDSGSGAGLAAPPRSALSENRGRPRELGVTLQLNF